MQMLPPTVAAFQILNEARKELQQSCTSGRAVHSRGGGEVIQLGDLAGRGDFETVGGHAQRRPVQRIEIDQGVGRELRLGKQPGAAGEPGIAVAPCVIWSADDGRFTSVMVLRFMSPPP